MVSDMRSNSLRQRGVVYGQSSPLASSLIGHYDSTMARRRSGLKRSLPVLLLFLFASGLRTFRAWQVPTIMPGAIRHIEQAQQLSTDVVAAIRGDVIHPLHSAAVLFAHTVITCFSGPSH